MDEIPLVEPFVLLAVVRAFFVVFQVGESELGFSFFVCVKVCVCVCLWIFVEWEEKVGERRKE